MLNVPYSGSIARLALEWYYIVGPVLGCVVIFAVGWYICVEEQVKRILIKTDFAQSNKCKKYLLKIYSQRVFLNTDHNPTIKSSTDRFCSDFEQ